MSACRILPFTLPVVLLVGGCASTELMNVGSNATTLQQAVAADHKTAINLLNQVNTADLPYRIEAEADAAAFSAAGLNLLDPADIASWDKILTALDSYCAALDHLAAGTQSTEFQTATETLGSDIQSLATTANLSDSHGPAVATALTELGSLVIRYKAATEAQTLARAADPSFQIVIRDLIAALGFAGEPPVATTHGVLATYEADFATGNAEHAKSFQGSMIAGFAALSPAEKRASIQAFVAWQAAQRDDASLVDGLKALATALDQAAAAHAALAHGTPDTVTSAFDQLKAEIQNVKAIDSKFSKG
jgi:hypothetical protein